MNDSEKSKLLNELKKDLRVVFNDDTPDAPKAKKLVSKLNQISRNDKPYFKNFAEELNEKLFSTGVSIKGFDVEAFSKDVVKEKDHSDRVTKVSIYSTAQAAFKELLRNMINSLKDHLQIIKGYFIVKFEIDPTQTYQPLVLHDQTFYIEPIKRVVLDDIDNAKCLSYDEFINALEKGEATGNYLCLLLLTAKSNDKKGIKSLLTNLEKIFDNFATIEYYSIKNFDNLKGQFFESSNRKEELIDEIEYVISTHLSNKNISNEEEKIIKKLFLHSQTPIIIYKMIKSGNSGAKVVEVQPKKPFGTTQEKRYIVKYIRKDDRRKLKVEAKRFDSWIGDYKGGFSEYISRYETTLTYEGIRYDYAVSDSDLESYSYASILGDDENKFHSNKAGIVDELFDIELFSLWKDSREMVEDKVSNLYKDYIKPENAFKEIGKILDIENEEISKNELIVNFNKIWDYKLKCYQKVCHGDLHSENFFKDQNGVYLIDFGFTDKRHAVIDHTSLECSIKFKHFPFYIPIDVLTTVENELLSQSTFQLSHNFNKSNRNDIIQLLEVIKKIRHNSHSLIFDTNSRIEYYISLFVMTFKQIQYSDLNQQFAYNSALILGQKIVDELGI